VTDYNLKLQIGGMPKGEEVEIPGLGVFKNGEERLVTEEQVAFWRQVRGRQVDIASTQERAQGLSRLEYQLGPDLKEVYPDAKAAKTSKEDAAKRAEDTSATAVPPVGVVLNPPQQKAQPDVKEGGE